MVVWKDPERFIIRSAWRTWEYQNQPRSYIRFPLCTVAWQVLQAKLQKRRKKVQRKEKRNKKYNDTV